MCVSLFSTCSSHVLRTSPIHIAPLLFRASATSHTSSRVISPHLSPSLSMSHVFPVLSPSFPQGHKTNATLFPTPHPVYGKGVLVQGTLWGNLILGPTARDTMVKNEKTGEYELNPKVRRRREGGNPPCSVPCTVYFVP